MMALLPICRSCQEVLPWYSEGFFSTPERISRMLLMDYWPVQLFMQQVMLCIGI